MTKYILNSGGSKNYPAKAALFYGEIVKNLGRQPRILLCFFAEKREEWENKFSNYLPRLKELVEPGIEPVIELAFPDEFAEQMNDNDAIIIHGGDDHLLQYWLRQFDLPALWQGKVVAASSAGSDALASHFWTCDWRRCMDGLGILPIKFIPHYRSVFYGADDPRGPIDWQQAYHELAEYGDNSLPVYALEEGDYQIFEI